ncbi:hypothetical protein ILUMI_01034 [Ignelater luminosus]|uniref:Uncharacterized protein n=1 Tax=Ignelater luminosus TaxID=2038154 RepID=A0A8K0GM31_IGNLU|nr:hypothetical protein ILUMI_01034 [Ignelater luminosus]
MKATSSSSSSDLEKISQSRFLLAKYRIQVIDLDKIVPCPIKISKDNVGDGVDSKTHQHIRPDALEYNSNEGSCNKDKFMQILWSLLLPCIAVGQFCFNFANSCFDLGSEITTHLEEDYELKWCFCCECCRLKITPP